MHKLERFFTRLRHLKGLKNLSLLWAIIRPFYDFFFVLLTRKRGIQRTFNGSDPIRLDPKWRMFRDTYEPAVWKLLSEETRPGDIVVDVGAFLGLYAITLAKRVGTQGHVVAYEPDPGNFLWLKRHIELNQMGQIIDPRNKALGNQKGEISFVAGRDSESRAKTTGDTEQGIQVPVFTLDEEFPHQKIDILKIDVEGYEEYVLRGGAQLLQDPSRCPRKLYIEVHPFAWNDLEVSSDSLLSLIEACGYQVSTLDGDPIKTIDAYGEIVASKEKTLIEHAKIN